MPGLILPYRGIVPTIDPSAFIAETATVIGDVEIGEGASVWYGCTVRGDVNDIRIGAGTNLQDGTVVHVTRKRYPTRIGAEVTVGHKVLLHGCILEDGCFIGMGATIMDGAVIESGAMVAAGALVTPGKRVKSGELWAGSPAKPRRLLTEEERAHLGHSAENYRLLAAEYLNPGGPDPVAAGH